MPTQAELEAARGEYLSRVVVPLARFPPNHDIRPAGCGFLFRQHGHGFLVTAAHVAGHLQTVRFGVPASPVAAQEIFSIHGGVIMSAVGGDDVAVVSLDEASIDGFREGGWLFLDENDLAPDHPCGPRRVFGWPHSLMTGRHDQGRLEEVHSVAVTFEANAVNGWDALKLFPELRPGTAFDYFLAWPESPLPTEALNGISGSPIWVRRNQPIGRTLTPKQELRLAGVVTAASRAGGWVRVSPWQVVTTLVERASIRLGLI